eukprot:jgi/Botrbrau1/21504/Bobra.174_2s0012.2
MRLRSIKKVLLFTIFGISSLYFQESYASCEYGRLPGRWVAKNASLHTYGPWRRYVPTYWDMQWELFDTRCQILDLLGPRLKALDRLAKNETGVHLFHFPQYRILLLGDSIERHMVADLCAKYSAANEPFLLPGDYDNRERCKKDYMRCGACELPTLTVYREPLHGVMGTWDFEDEIGYRGELSIRIPKVLKNFRARFGGDPDLIVISSNLWDLSFWTHFQPEVLAQEDLNQHVIQSWLRNAAKLFHVVQASAEEGTPLVYHTVPYPRLDDYPHSGKHGHFEIGTHSQVAQLNAAGRHLASVYNYHLVDVEQMTSSFYIGYLYLKDTHHPATFVSFNVLNIYLNLIRQVQAGLSQKRPHNGS